VSCSLSAPKPAEPKAARKISAANFLLESVSQIPAVLHLFLVLFFFFYFFSRLFPASVTRLFLPCLTRFSLVRFALLQVAQAPQRQWISGASPQSGSHCKAASEVQAASLAK
jgi:hypothetical protein